MIVGSLSYLFRGDGYFIDWDYLEKKEGLEDKLQQFLELGQSIINEAGTLFPDGMVIEDGNVCMNGEWVEDEEEEVKN